MISLCTIVRPIIPERMLCAEVTLGHGQMKRIKYMVVFIRT